MFIRFAAFVLIASSATTAFGVGYPLSSKKFVHEPTGYVVKVQHEGETMYLRGRHPVTGERFRLSVSPTGNVRGRFAGRELNYRIGERPRAEQAMVSPTSVGAGAN